MMNRGDGKSRRSITISGKISSELNDSICKCIDGIRYRSKNDIVEEALMQWIETKRNGEGKEGGTSLGN